MAETEFFLSIFNQWDLVLLAAVVSMAVAIAYIRHPRWKAFIPLFPVPFTVATLSIGEPVGPTHVSGLLLLLVFIHLVRVLYTRTPLPILPAVFLAAAAYCAAASLLAGFIPDNPAVFWIACATVLAAAAICLRALPEKKEPGARTSLPLLLKIPVTILVVASLVMMKRQLSGFMVFFPMVGVFAAYESRLSLSILARQINLLMFIILPMVITVYLVQEIAGIGAAFAAGWAVFLVCILPLFRQLRTECKLSRAPGAEHAPPVNHEYR